MKVRTTKIIFAGISALTAGALQAQPPRPADRPDAQYDRPYDRRQDNRYDNDRHYPRDGQEWLAREVRHELVMLPWYGVFDDLAFRVDGNTVTLFGAVTRPTLAKDAERAVRRLEGVGRVINNIEVLPPSPNDDRIRRSMYRAIYGSAGLDRYAMNAVPPIHIIVKNGHVVLRGVVGSEADRRLAYMKARGVHGAFSVENELTIGE